MGGGYKMEALDELFEEVPLESPREEQHLNMNNPPMLSLNGFSLMKLLRSVYETDNPRETLELFLLDYSISPHTLCTMVDWILWQHKKGGHNHPLAMIGPEIQSIRESAYSMQPHMVKTHFLFLCTTLSFVWVDEKHFKKGMVAHLSKRCAPVFYKAPNTKTPYMWLCTTPFGMLHVVSSHLPIPFSVSLKRKEQRGNMMPLEVDVFPQAVSRAHLHMEIDVQHEETFSVTGVDKTIGTPDFMLLLTTNTKHMYLRSVLIQPASGTFLLYPVCINAI